MSRECQACGARMSPFIPRKRRESDNKLVCAGCEGLNPQPFQARRRTAARDLEVGDHVWWSQGLLGVVREIDLPDNRTTVDFGEGDWIDVPTEELELHEQFSPRIYRRRKVAYGEPHKSKAFPPGTDEATIQAWISKLPKYVQPLVERVVGSDGTTIVSVVWPSKPFNPMFWVRDPEWDAMIPDSIWNVGENVSARQLQVGDLISLDAQWGVPPDPPPITTAREVTGLDEYGFYLEGAQGRIGFGQSSGYYNGRSSERTVWRYHNRAGAPARRSDLGRAAVRKHAHDSGDGETIRRHAHDSGDGETIYHCPFCFTADVRYATRDGIKTFGETVGTTQWVLTADEHDRTGGRWVEAHIHEFGEQPIMEVTIKRNKRRKVIEATPEHRWIIKSDRRVAGAKARSTDRSVITSDLRPGHRLSYLLPEGGVGDLVPSEEGIRHGVVFGDGSAQGRYAVVSLWGEKDKQLLRYFPDRNYREVNTATRALGTGVPGVHVTGDLWAWMKAIPESDDPAYLYGWLAGYFAADGNVTKQGQAVLNSAKIEHLEAVRDIALRLGIATYGITSKLREGFPGREPSLLFGIEFVGSTLNEDFFLIEEHRDRFRFRNYDYERIGWTVESVKMTDRVEPVYCAVVPETHSFALEDHIWVGNCGAGQVTGRSDGTAECNFCSTTFTVQVQPQRAAVPQTIDGTPHVHPDMPGSGGGEPGVPEEIEDPTEDPASTEVVPDNPLFAKRHYITAAGVALPEDAYIRHLAVMHAEDPDGVLAQVRAANGRTASTAEPTDPHARTTEDAICKNCGEAIYYTLLETNGPTRSFWRHVSTGYNGCPPKR